MLNFNLINQILHLYLQVLHRSNSKPNKHWLTHTDDHPVIYRINHFEYKIPHTFNELYMNDRSPTIHNASKAKFHYLKIVIHLQTEKVSVWMYAYLYMFLYFRHIWYCIWYMLIILHFWEIRINWVLFSRWI